MQWKGTFEDLSQNVHFVQYEPPPHRMLQFSGHLVVSIVLISRIKVATRMCVGRDFAMIISAIQVGYVTGNMKHEPPHSLHRWLK